MQSIKLNYSTCNSLLARTLYMYSRGNEFANISKNSGLVNISEFTVPTYRTY